jgi:hypothetical protein
VPSFAVLEDTLADATHDRRRVNFLFKYLRKEGFWGWASKNHRAPQGDAVQCAVGLIACQFAGTQLDVCEKVRHIWNLPLFAHRTAKTNNDGSITQAPVTERHVLFNWKFGPRVVDLIEWAANPRSGVSPFPADFEQTAIWRDYDLATIQHANVTHLFGEPNMDALTEGKMVTVTSCPEIVFRQLAALVRASREEAGRRGTVIDTSRTYEALGDEAPEGKPFPGMPPASRPS